MKEYLISSLMLVVSTIVGMILYTYYYYYFFSANSEAPIFGAAIMMVYGFIAFALLLNSISKKGGLPHNTFTKTHLELDMEREK
ncbi:hypothetical protein [Butyrivibrio sp. JL13D10]|uniref:hypothetical protein n=1 Tax=Butyrivibrio sp. JL13D10 TaxID=3236815 RepID=UPI0038B5F279